MATPIYQFPNKRQIASPDQRESRSPNNKGYHSVKWQSDAITIPSLNRISTSNWLPPRHSQQTPPVTATSFASRSHNPPTHSTVQGLAGEALIPGSIVFIPPVEQIPQDSGIHKVLNGSNPFRHPAVVLGTQNELVELFVLTSFTNKTRQSFGNDWKKRGEPHSKSPPSARYSSLRQQYPNDESHAVRKARERYMYIRHPEVTSESFSNPESQVPELRMAGGYSLRGPCYVNVQRTYVIEPQYLAWNRVDGAVQPHAHLDQQSVLKMLSWHATFLSHIR